VLTPLGSLAGRVRGEGPQAESTLQALKRGREGSDNRVVESLYHQALSGNVTACIFWLKNRRPSEWRDVQNVDAAIGHYIISDRPMTEQQWIEARADRAKPVTPQLPQADQNRDKSKSFNGLDDRDP
jgi:hypothetical protein